MYQQQNPAYGYPAQNQINSSYMQPNQQMTNPTPMGYAHGGKVKKAHLTLAHVSPHELHIMDHLQGGTERHNHSGVRSFTHLEELLKNPHIRETVHMHAHHHKHGGETEHGHESMEHMRHMGRHGDTEVALIGPHTHHLFNTMAGHSTRNPHDGHPEYFSIGNALGGLWDTVKGGAGQAWNAVKNNAGAVGRAALPALHGVAQPFLNKYLGENIGNAVGSYGKDLAQQGLNSMGGNQGSTVGTAIGQGIGNAAQTKAQGGTYGEALGAGLNRAGAGIGNNVGGNAIRGAGQALQSGQGLRGAASNALNLGSASVNNPAAAGAMQGAASGLQSGQGMRGTLAQAGRQGYQGLGAMAKSAMAHRNSGSQSLAMRQGHGHGLSDLNPNNTEQNY